MNVLAFLKRGVPVCLAFAIYLSESRGADASFVRVPSSFGDLRGGAMAWGDYDNDGYLDVIVIGDGLRSNGFGVTVLYHNNHDGTFTPAPITFPGYRSGSVAWGDFDNDGYLDLLISGLGTDSLTRVYRNLGGTNFVSFKTFGMQYDGTASWGDFNNDGKLDFAVCGAGSYNEVYQNLGGTNFVLLNTGMTNVYYGSVSWADFDRDGDLDLLVTGMDGGAGHTFLYRNTGGGHFNLAWMAAPWEPGQWLDIDNDGWPDIAVGLWPSQVTYVYRNDRNGGFGAAALLPIGPLTVGDFNNDGWTDLLINNKLMQNSGTGTWATVNTSLPDMGTSTLINNAFCGDFDNDGRLDLILSDSTYTTYLYKNTTAVANVPPSIPPGLTAAATRTNVVLSWKDAVDQNQAGGLTYNVRVGTAPGAVDVISPMSAPDGFRRVVRSGNSGSLTHYTLTGLSAGRKYYWSVQAVDNSFAGSGFAAEQSFVATVPPTISGLVDQTIFQDSAPLSVPFAVADAETPASQLAVAAVSSNTQLVSQANLVISGNGTNRTLVITIPAAKFGLTTITVTVTDQDGGQASQQFQLTVLRINHPPVAEIVVSPLLDLPGLTNPTVMAPLCQDATVVLDGSRSTDPDGDALLFSWTEGIANTPIGNGVSITNQFSPGSYLITLSVSDGTNTARTTVELDVISPAEAVTTLEAYVWASDLPRGHKQALLASLDAAEASFVQCRATPGVNQLQAFQSKVTTFVQSRNPTLAAQLIGAANDILLGVMVLRTDSQDLGAYPL